ncbi:unnamed protein product, partial [Rotaria magnacalcarata]
MRPEYDASDNPLYFEYMTGYLDVDVVRDSRFNNESKTYTQFLRTGFPPPFDISIAGIRERAEALHKKINEKLIDKFKGKEQEKNVRINKDLEIPITIYTPTDVEKDKMVIFFHGGGWTVNSR